MRCETARDHFSDYVSGHAHEALRAALDLHLAGCSSCRREVEDLKLLWRALDRLEVVQAPAGLRAEVWRRIDAEAAQRPQRRAWLSGRLFTQGFAWRRAALWGAGACLVALLAGVTVPGSYQRAVLGDFGLSRFLPHAPAQRVHARVSSIRPVAVADQVLDEVVISLDADGPPRKLRVTPLEGRAANPQDVSVAPGHPGEIVIRVDRRAQSPGTISLKIEEDAVPPRVTILQVPVPVSP